MNPTKEEIEEALAHFAPNNIRLLDMDWSMAQTLAAAYREAIKERDEARDIARAFQKREWGMND